MAGRGAGGIQAVDVDGRLSLLAFDETVPNQPRRFGKGDGALPLPLAGTPQSPLDTPPLRAAGLLDGSGPLLIESPDGVAYSADGATWSAGLKQNLASLSAAPDFRQTGVALAGGFRTGIFRTNDGGRTWSQVLTESSALIEGSEAMDVVYISSRDAVAINGGELLWRPF